MALDLKTLNFLVGATRDDPLFDDYYNSKETKDFFVVSGGSDSPALVAIDCEMVCTNEHSMELGRVSILSFCGTTLYEQFVIPDNKVIDWRTFISGCDEETAAKKGVSPNVARNDICKLIAPNTIIVGHALNHDLQTLKIKHDRVIDTAFLYPAKQKSNKPNKRMSLPLRYLIHCLVENKDPVTFDLDSNQIDLCGNRSDDPHDSMQDARWALELVLGAMEAYGTGTSLDHTLHVKDPYLLPPPRPRAIGICNLPYGSEEPLQALVTAAGTYAPSPVWITPPCYALRSIQRKVKIAEENDIQIEMDGIISSGAEEPEDMTVTETIPMGVSNLLFSTKAERDEFFDTFIILLGAMRQIKLSPLPKGTVSGELIGELVRAGYGPVVSARIPAKSRSGFVTFANPESAYKILGLSCPSLHKHSSKECEDSWTLTTENPEIITLNLKGRNVNLSVEVARVQEFTTPVPILEGSPRLHVVKR